MTQDEARKKQCRIAGFHIIGIQPAQRIAVNNGGGQTQITIQFANCAAGDCMHWIADPLSAERDGDCGMMPR